MSLSLNGRLSASQSRETNATTVAAEIIKSKLMQHLESSIATLRATAEKNEADVEISSVEENFYSDADRVFTTRSIDDNVVVGWSVDGDAEGADFTLPYQLLKCHTGGWALSSDSDSASEQFANISEIMIHILNNWFSSLDFHRMAGMNEAQVESYMASTSPFPMPR